MDSNLDSFIQTTDINELWSEWYDKFICALDTCAPLKLKRERRKKCAWMNGELLSLIHKRKMLYRQLKSGHFSDSNLFQLYKRTRNASNNLYRRLKNEFYQRCCVEYSRCRSKLWNVIRNVTGGGCAWHSLSIPVDELSSYFASLVSSGTGNAPHMFPKDQICMTHFLSSLL